LRFGAFVVCSIYILSSFSFALLPRVARIPNLARLRALHRSALEFALGLEPIVQLKPRPFTTF